MAFKDYIDEDTRKLLLIIIGLVILLYVILPNIRPYFLGPIQSQSEFQSISSYINKASKEQSESINLDLKKDYKAVVQTSVGDFEIDLYEKSAPKNVSNFISNLSGYQNSVIDVDKNFLIKITSNSNISYYVEDEINADYLLLNTIKVKDATYLRNIYDPKDPSTKPFEPNNLRKYEDFTVKQFYSEILGYKYNSTLSTPKAVKYLVYMASSGPNTNKVNFFILMANSAPEIDGRYTPIGRVTGGLTTLDKINNSDKPVKVQSIVVP